VKRLQERLPILLSISFVTTILALTFFRLSTWTGAARIAAFLFVGAYLLWIAVEAKVAVGEIGKGQTRLDRGTLELYAFGRAATVVAALAVAPAQTEITTRAAIGFALFVAAVLLRLGAIRELGRFYSHRVRLRGDHKIVDTGPYRFVRHPAYTGMIFAHLGVVLFFFSWPAAALLGVLFVPAVVLRILVEEKALMETLDGYREFSRGRPRLIPLVW
jgi:protein-S-isoprenylcysteine O-methyltransferase Ste14